MLSKKHRGGHFVASERMNILIQILKGLIISIAVTLTGMLLIALLTVFTRLSDSMLTALNQILKIISIMAGTAAAVGRGGRRGFVTGATTALLYMILGYAVYILLGGIHSVSLMLGEMLMGAAVGAFTGAVLANMNPKKRRR